MTPPVTAAEPARTWFGWQPETVAFFFGMSGRRTALLAVAVLTAIWPLAVSQWNLAVLTWPVAAACAAFGLVRVAGRTGDEWLTSVISYGWLRAQGQHTFLSGPFAPAVRRG